MEESFEYGEDLYMKHVTGCYNYATDAPRYNSKKLYAINISLENKKDIIAIEPLVEKLFQEYAEYGFEVNGLPHILFFRKICDEAEHKEMNINDYIDELDSITREKINQYDKHLDIIDRIDKKFKINLTKREMNETEEDDGTFSSSVLYGSTVEQTEQYQLIYSFAQFYECMIYDIISYLYIKISKLRHLWFASDRKKRLIENWKIEEERMLKNTPFKDWKEWYNFLRTKYYSVYYKKLEDESE